MRCSMRPKRICSAITLAAVFLALGAGIAASGPATLASPSDAMLEQAAGGCQLPSANCFLSDACVNEGGTWFYYFYKGGGIGADSNPILMGNPKCFEKWRYSQSNCGNAVGSVTW